MKTSPDPRRIRRIRRFKKNFSGSFLNQRFNQEIDQIISAHAPEWPINKLNKIDLAILRLAISELKSANPPPPKVVIDEAIEIGKIYGTAKTPKFINGVLNSIINEK